MKFGSWTFDGNLINLEHIDKKNSIMEKNTIIPKNGLSTKLYTVQMGIDMSDYYQSVEWDILSIPAQKNIKYYACCAEPYMDIYFNITIRRKTLFYTVNLIIPCVNISFLSVLVFYLPSDSGKIIFHFLNKSYKINKRKIFEGEKLTLSISILVALLVFYLLLIELIPPTSLTIPLLGKYLLFTLILVNLSIIFTIIILNLNFRRPNVHQMPKWIRKVFIDVLPKMLCIERPGKKEIDANNKLKNNDDDDEEGITAYDDVLDRALFRRRHYSLGIRRAFDGVKYINKKMKNEDIFKGVSIVCLFVCVCVRIDHSK